MSLKEDVEGGSKMEGDRKEVALYGRRGWKGYERGGGKGRTGMENGLGRDGRFVDRDRRGRKGRQKVCDTQKKGSRGNDRRSQKG